MWLMLNLIGHGLARFDYMDANQRNIALAFRDAEVPFIVHNVPDLETAISTTFSSAQLLKNIGNDVVSVEKLPTNNYMFYQDIQNK